MGALMRSYDWASHPLGSPDAWPESLKSTIRLLLNSRFPMFVWWSQELYAFHNDAYLPALGEKHPAALGTPARVLWAEAWDQLGQIAEPILTGGAPFYAQGLYIPLKRKGFMEDTYWTFSYSPAFDDEGLVNGIFCACYEETMTVLGQRRLKTLKDISEGTSQIETLADACQTICHLLTQNVGDVPFCQIYLLHEQESEVQLLGQAGVTETMAPSVISLQEELGKPGYWPLARTQRSRQKEVVLHHGGSFVPAGQVPAHEKAVMVPIFRPGQEDMLGFLVAGLSNKLDYDLPYQDFHELVAGQIATSIASVQAQLETSRRQAYLTELFQQAPVAICIMSGPEHMIDMANPGICELWGKKYEDVIGKPVLEALPEVRNQGIKELLDGVVQTGIPYVNNELAIELMRNGALETVYVSFVYHPLRDTQGNIMGVIAIALGINEQVEARHQMEAKNRELLAINADLDNFVYSASHDLRAPISNIEGLIDALIEDLPPQVLQREVVSRVVSLIQGSVERFKRTVSDLTEVAKIQREAGEDVGSINLAEVVEKVCLDFDSAMERAGARVETDFTSNASIQFSAKNVRSVVYNLISNALKYRSPERPPVLRIATDVTPTHVMLSVQDNGLGLKVSDHGKIFSMFKRLHDHVEGTGIGLYIVKRIVENAGGHIEVESTIGQGTTFKVYFKR
ncbi:PAS domain-containing protein [Nibribacter ruber]|uniref:histidine kinase n=2 Tax=Nibribacter ruber TaxID=2698458 RepID=A0A6P1P504_9BACT|nr:PAS domain-containing protein [Nibribacter ruber]